MVAKKPISLGCYVRKIAKRASGGAKADFAESARRALSAATAELLVKIADEAGKLAKLDEVSTITSKHATAAVKLVVSGELGMHAKAESLKALAKSKPN